MYKNLVLGTVACLTMLSFSSANAFFDDMDDNYYAPESNYYENNNNYEWESSSHHRSFRHSSHHNWIEVNLRNLTWEAYDNEGYLVRTGRVSGGKAYCPDVHRGCRSPTGTFTIHSKRGAGCFSTKFPVGKGGAPMPYCMFFKGGYALHGSNDVPNHNASHGCVRTTPEQARWLNQNFVRVGSTRIHIHY